MLTIELEPELEMNLKAVAEQEHCSVNDMVKRFISVCLKERQSKDLNTLPQTEGQRILQVLDEYDLLGCMEGNDGELSVNYKNYLFENEPIAEGQVSSLYKAFDEAGLIGCIETDEQLSTTYKEKIDFSFKHGAAK